MGAAGHLPSQGPVTAHLYLRGDAKDEVNIQGQPRGPPSGLSPLISTTQTSEEAPEAEKIIVKIQPRIAATLLSSMVPQALGSPAAQPEYNSGCGGGRGGSGEFFFQWRHSPKPGSG